MKSSRFIRSSRVLTSRLIASVCVICFAVSNVLPIYAQGDRITVRVNRPGAKISPTMHGLFFEDINFAADGGIYPERIKNRSFEFPDPMMGWKPVERANYKGTTYIINREQADAANRRFLRLAPEASASGNKGFGVTNEGFRGIGVQQGAEYTFTVAARHADKTRTSTSVLRVEIEDENNRALGSATINPIAPEWKTFTSSIRATGTHNKARLNIFVEGAGGIDLDLVSLYPKETYNNRPNGLRPDLVQLLKDMKPGFLRFPGGCIVEGRTLDQRYQWKTTVGDLDDRQLIVNRWNTEFRHRPAPDYYQSFGLGFYEYFQLSEDIGAEPLPILNCGMACQFNSGELASMEDLDHYIQDALDLVAFANDPVTTDWGKKRAEMGHPQPFNLKMIGVGNEQWGPQYVERYKVFHRVLKEKHPDIKLISSVGPAPEGERFDFLWKELRASNTDIIDEHYYMEPKWFRDNATRYDDYPRNGPKVFAGEFASQSVGIASPDNRNNWEGALSEAAFMTGLERNADLVVMASYAPLFGHVDAWQWTPNAIWFDNLRAYATPNYYVQQMFGANRGTTILPVTINDSPKNKQNDLYASASIDEGTKEVILKVVNVSSTPRQIAVNLIGAAKSRPAAQTFVLTAPDMKSENSLDEPKRVAPAEGTIAVRSNKLAHTFAPHSLTVIRVSSARGK